MKITIAASRQSAVHSVVDMCKDAAEESNVDAYSTTLELVIAELVRSRMRLLAADAGFWNVKDGLLHHAARLTHEELEAMLAKHNVSYDVDHFIRRAEKNLKFPGRELQELGLKLAESKERRRIALPEEGTTHEGQPYAIHRLGLKGATTGLLARRLGDEAIELDFDNVRRMVPCEIWGDYFPFEVLIGETVFVIDDDGSIFCSVESLPPRLIHEIENTLRKLADSVYV